MRKLALLSALIVLSAACSEDGTSDSTGTKVDPTTYVGTWNGGESSGAIKNGTITFQVTNGVITGDVAPISGSLRALTGSVSGSGAITASLARDPNLNGCAVTLSGQTNSTTSSGAASASGTYVLVQSSTCNTNSGTWTATRPAAP
jgi:hypothetical protein